MTDLQEAFSALSGKLSRYNTLFNYADGEQPLQYSTTRLREAFRDITTRFQENWCAVVVDAAQDRLMLNGWDAASSAANRALDQVWRQQQVFLDADDAHRDALITGEGFIIAWMENDVIEVYHNDARMCQVFYDPSHPKRKRFAAKWWTADETWYITLYYADRLEYYAAKSKTQPSSANAFKPATPAQADNPFGVIPVFHFRGPGELGLKITTLQDAINKLFADMMIAAEYGAFKQRYVISNSDTSALKNAPNEVWEIPAGDGTGQQSSVGQFEETALKNFMEPIDRLASSIAIISRTPKHYFYNMGANLSGESLLAMEGPLNKKSKKYQERFGVTWQELGAFLAKLAGAGEVDPATITPLWQPTESIQPFTEAQTRQLAISAGIPLVTQLRWEGKQKPEIEQLMRDKDEEKKRNAAMAPLLLERARVENEQTNPPENGGNNQSEENNA